MAFQQARPYSTGADALGTMGDIQRLVTGERQNRLGDLQFQLEQQKAERANAAYQAQQALLGQITDPRERLAATMAPDKFAGSVFRDPKDNYMSDGAGGLWDLRGPDGKPVRLGDGPGWRPMTGGAPGGAPPSPSPSPGANLAAARPTIAPGPRQTKGGMAAAPAIYQEYIKAAAGAYGVDAEVLSNMLLTETAPNGPLTSKAGARGVMQFMPGTAKQYGVDVNDPGSSIDGAGRMMAYLLKKYDGDYRLAVGAYNWGEGNVDNWLKNGADVTKLPRETVDYVGGVVGLNTPGPNDTTGQPGDVRVPGQAPAGGRGPGQTDTTPPLVPIVNGKGEINNDFGVDAQGRYWPWPKSGTTVNVDTGAKTGTQTLVKARADRLGVLREKGMTAIDLKPKLQTLRDQLTALKTQGPGSGTVLRALGVAQTVARAFGMDQETVHRYTEQLTGMKGDDPETAAKANKIVSDLVTVGLRAAYAGLGSASNMEREGIERAQANTENPIGANMYLIDNILMPGMDRDLALWERVMPLQSDPELTNLDAEEMRFRREWAEKHKTPTPDQGAGGEATPAATDTVPNPIQVPPNQGTPAPAYSAERQAAIRQQYPDALVTPQGDMVIRNPDNPPGGPNPYLRIKP